MFGILGYRTGFLFTLDKGEPRKLSHTFSLYRYMVTNGLEHFKKALRTKRALFFGSPNRKKVPFFSKLVFSNVNGIHFFIFLSSYGRDACFAKTLRSLHLRKHSTAVRFPKSPLVFIQFLFLEKGERLHYFLKYTFQIINILPGVNLDIWFQ